MYALLLLPVRLINGPIAGVAIPAPSCLQSKPDQYRRYYLKVVQSLAYVSMLVVVMLAVLAEEVVLLVLGSQWLDAAIIFQIFAAFVIVQSVMVTTGWVLQSLGPWLQDAQVECRTGAGLRHRVPDRLALGASASQ